MFMVSLFKWWYGDGWKNKLKLARESFFKMADFFSIGLLFKTIFAPFRQISANTNMNGSIGDKLRGLFDKLFSRIIGAVMRLGLIIFGTVALILNVIWSLFKLITWPLIPVLPFVGVILSISGWVPVWL